MEWEFNSYYTLIAATLVLLIGSFGPKGQIPSRDFQHSRACGRRLDCCDYLVCAASGLRRELQI